MTHTRTIIIDSRGYDESLRQALYDANMEGRRAAAQVTKYYIGYADYYYRNGRLGKERFLEMVEHYRLRGFSDYIYRPSDYPKEHAADYVRSKQGRGEDEFIAPGLDLSALQIACIIAPLALFALVGMQIASGQ